MSNDISKRKEQDTERLRTVRVDIDIKNKIAAHAKLQNKPIYQLIEEILVDWLNNHKL